MRHVEHVKTDRLVLEEMTDGMIAHGNNMNAIKTGQNRNAGNVMKALRQGWFLFLLKIPSLCTLRTMKL